ncbi:ARM repeat superfamily protein [Striga hermonthica]|uniref:ARM repeat superfamily protein n=1 Tax=Striga hermonthica TaxID=68872 RepID=A0A9N7MXC0_STRHE|nr:ARM repeat superfamily protein [Striga hermonthica]
MEGVEMETAPPEKLCSEDFCSAVLSQFSRSNNEHHLHICAAIGAMSQELIDQNLPLTPIAYFGATCSSIDRLSASVDSPSHLLEALLTILSLVIDRFSPSVLRSKFDYLSELLIRVLGAKSVGVNGLVPGMKCASRLLVVRENVSWADVAQLYGVLIGYIADERPKVRKQSHLCLRETLEYFHLVPPLVAPASESITNAFERFLLIAGGSNATASEGPKAAQEVLYILDALKACLPYMSSKSSTNILKYFKSLLELRHPIVTRRIADGLNALCLHAVGEISAEILTELLCSLITSVSPHESSADGMTFTARLLDTGMKRVYFLNRQICVVKLPLVFNALKDILASEHEEASVAAVATFKSLIQSCIDESLIKQGVDQITVNADAATRQTSPTVIEKICATVESLLDYHYEPVWDMSFQVVSTLFDKLGKDSSYFLKGTLKSLADMQKMPDENFTFKKQFHECMGTALGAMGPESFLSLLPLNLEIQDLSESNLWLFPILKQYTVGANLSFFTNSILPMIVEMKKKSAEFERVGKLHSARSVDGIVYSLWSLLPSFCNYPLDTAESFKVLEKALCTALQEEPEVRGLICSGLQILIQQNKRILEGNQDRPSTEIGVAEERAMTLYTADVAGSNLHTLKSSARELLTVLTGIYSKFSKDTIGILQSTIVELASILDKETVSRFFKKTMQKLLTVTQDVSRLRNNKDSNAMQVDDSSRAASLSTARAQLFDLAVSLLPGLDSKEVDLLFTAVTPALKDADGLIQKKAYRALSLILQTSDDFILRKLEVVLSLMIEVLPSCHFSAKRQRLDCLYFLIIHAIKEGSEKRRHDITASFLTEIILALKEANKKTRNRAYDILVQIGHACGDEDQGGEEKLRQFFNMVAGGLAGETPHMISAAMTGLARLAYEFSDLVSAAYNLLPSAFLLLQRKNKEIIKANLGLLKVLVAKSQAEGLKAHLRGMVEGLLSWQDSTKNHFKAKIKLLLEMLVKKCGLDAVKEVMPEDHMKLLTNIRKLKNRKEKKQAAKSLDDRSILSKATTSRISRWNHTKIFSELNDNDSNDSDGEFTDGKSIVGRHSKYSLAVQSKSSLSRSKKSRKAAKSLQEDSFDQLDDEPLDLLDTQRMRSALRPSQPQRMKDDESDDEPLIDPDGRLVIQEEGKSKKADRKKKRESLDAEENDGKSEAGSHLSSKSAKTQKRRKTSESGWAYTGKEYASKKAGGDVKRKDKLEPYAYWPLDRKMVSRRPEHRAAARKGMASVVKLTKRLEGRSVSSALSVKGVALKNKRKGSKKKF